MLKNINLDDLEVMWAVLLPVSAGEADISQWLNYRSGKVPQIVKRLFNVL